MFVQAPILHDVLGNYIKDLRRSASVLVQQSEWLFPLAKPLIVWCQLAIHHLSGLPMLWSLSPKTWTISYSPPFTVIQNASPSISGTPLIIYPAPSLTQFLHRCIYVSRHGSQLKPIATKKICGKDITHLAYTCQVLWFFEVHSRQQERPRKFPTTALVLMPGFIPQMSYCKGLKRRYSPSTHLNVTGQTAYASKFFNDGFK